MVVMDAHDHDDTDMSSEEFEKRIATGTPVAVSPVVPQNPFVRPTTSDERDRDTYSVGSREFAAVGNQTAY